jgi:SAM-dependent methyltransferase
VANQYVDQLAFVSQTHLDLGCGRQPRNPYGAPVVFGVDIVGGQGANVVAADLNCEPIPFADEHFDSVSAYDFLEHVPRVSHSNQSGSTVFPFVQLMNEICRVLKPGGRFYASSPCFPHDAAFIDPTHVNPLTKKSHVYFVGEEPLAKMYGFVGSFDLLRAYRYRPRVAYADLSPSFFRRVQRRAEVLVGDASHILWEFAKSRR